MLQAKMLNGRLVVAAELTRAEMAQLRRNRTKFFCPECHHEVIVKAGTQVTPHFAHRSLSQCSLGGGEGEYHQRGKLLLYRWLKSQGLQVTLEQHIPEIDQRPDLYLRINDKQIAIEYQCAKISTKEIHQRNAGYRRAGITPIWIIGAKRLNRRGSCHFKFDQMTLQLVHQFTSRVPQTVYYFCPLTLHLIRLSDLHFIQPNRLIAKLKTNGLDRFTFKDFFQTDSFEKTDLFRLWKKEKKYFRLQPRARAFGAQLSWLQWLYLKQTHIESLPSIIHLPISSQYKMKTPVWNWQSRLCLEIIDPLKEGTSFTLKRCEVLLRHHIHSPAYFTLIQPANHPIREYLDLLVQLGILKKQKDKEYIKTGPLAFHRHLEEALVQDEKLMERLCNAARHEIH